MICFLSGVLSDYSTRLKYLFQGKYLIGLIGLGITLVFWNKITTRISSISLHTHSFKDRWAYYETALRIIKDYPLGTGGGGWLDLYPQYQNFAFNVRDVHSGYLQLILELGLPILIVFFALFILISWGIINAWINRSNANCAIVPAVMVLLIHPLIDFDWSFMSIGLVTLLFINMFMAETANKPIFILTKWRTWAFSGLILLTLLLAMQWSSCRLGEVGINKAKQDPLKAIVPLNWAVNINPCSVQNRLELAKNLGRVNQNGQLTTEVNLSEPGQQLYKAALIRPQSAEVHYKVGEEYILIGQKKIAYAHLYKAVQLAPYRQGYYVRAADVALRIGEQELAENSPDSVQWLLKPLELNQNMQQYAGKQPVWPTDSERMSKHNPKMDLILKKAQQYIDSIK